MITLEDPRTDSGSRVTPAYDELVRMFMALWQGAQGGQPPPTCLLLGPPGIGKTSVGVTLHQQIHQYRCDVREAGRTDSPLLRILDLSSMLPEDLMGLPWTSAEEPTCSYRPPAWLLDLCAPGAEGVLVLDDLPAAPRALQVACRQLALERRVHECRLAPGVFVLVTGNRAGDGAAARGLPSHFLNSVVVLELSPDLAGWLSWYRRQSGLDPRVPAFLERHPQHFRAAPEDADGRGVFATPRTWHMLGRLLPQLQEPSLRNALGRGLVGAHVSAEFQAWEHDVQAQTIPAASAWFEDASLRMEASDAPDVQLARIESIVHEGWCRAEQSSPGDSSRFSTVQSDVAARTLDALERAGVRHGEWEAVCFSRLLEVGFHEEELRRALVGTHRTCEYRQGLTLPHGQEWGEHHACH